MGKAPSKVSVLILYKLGHICDGLVEFSVHLFMLFTPKWRLLWNSQVPLFRNWLLDVRIHKCSGNPEPGDRFRTTLKFADLSLSNSSQQWAMNFRVIKVTTDWLLLLDQSSHSWVDCHHYCSRSLFFITVNLSKGL